MQQHLRLGMTRSQKVALLILSKSIKAMSQPKATTANEHSSDETKMKHAPSPLWGLGLGPGFSQAPRAKSLEDAVALDPLPTPDITDPFKHHPGASILKPVLLLPFQQPTCIADFTIPSATDPVLRIQGIFLVLSTQNRACYSTQLGALNKGLRISHSCDLIRSSKRHGLSFLLLTEIPTSTLLSRDTVGEAKLRKGFRGQMGFRWVQRWETPSFRSFLSYLFDVVSQIRGNLHIPLRDSVWALQVC